MAQEKIKVAPGEVFTIGGKQVVIEGVKEGQVEMVVYDLVSLTPTSAAEVVNRDIGAEIDRKIREAEERIRNLKI